MGTLTAIKGNKEYATDEMNVESYIKEGFDIYEDGKKVKTGKGKTISQDEFDELKKELNEIKETSGTIPDNEIIPILLEYAELKQIKTGNATTAKGILKKIKDSEG